MQKHHDDVDQIARLSSELKAGTWRANARSRSERRKSAWNLLLPLFAIPLWLGLMYVFFRLAKMAYVAFHPRMVASAVPLHGLGVALVVLPIVVASALYAMIGANVLVYRIPAAHRSLDREDRDFPGTDYESSQRALIKTGVYLSGIAFVLVLLGVSVLG